MRLVEREIRSAALGNQHSRGTLAITQGPTVCPLDVEAGSCLGVFFLRGNLLRGRTGVFLETGFQRDYVLKQRFDDVFLLFGER